MSSISNNCAICDKDTSETTVTVTKKGLISLVKASRARGDEKDAKFEERFNLKESTLQVHQNCRKVYTHPREILKAGKVLKNEEPSSSKDTLRSGSDIFDFKGQCLFCGANVMQAKSQTSKIRNASTIEIRDTILTHCRKRNDAWGLEVQKRICSEIDLVAAEAKYHANCFSRFLKQKSHGKSGRPLDVECEEAFEKLCCDIQNDNEKCQFSLKELQEKLVSYLPENVTPWSEKNLKLRLIGKLKNTVIITEVPGKPAVLCLKNKCDELISDEWFKNNTNTEEKRLKVLKAAAEILKEDIRSMVCDVDTYPAVDDVRLGGENQFPNSVDVFFNELITKGKNRDIKINALKNFVTSSVRVKSFISPLMLSLGIQLHRKYASRYLIDLLSKIGVSVAYSECLAFENSAITNNKDNVPEDSFIQFVFDNADFNIRTIDGHGTFHSMGGIMCISPSNISSIPTFERKKTPELSVVIGKFGSIPLQVRYII